MTGYYHSFLWLSQTVLNFPYNIFFLHRHRGRNRVLKKSAEDMFDLIHGEDEGPDEHDDPEAPSGQALPLDRRLAQGLDSRLIVPFTEDLKGTVSATHYQFTHNRCVLELFKTATPWRNDQGSKANKGSRVDLG